MRCEDYCLPTACLPAWHCLVICLPAACLRACLSLLCLDRSRGAEKTPQLVSRLAVFCCNVVQKSQTMTVSAGSLLSLLLLSLSLFLLLLPSMTSLHRALCDCRVPSPHATCHTQNTQHHTHTPAAICRHLHHPAWPVRFRSWPDESWRCWRTHKKRETRKNSERESAQRIVLVVFGFVAVWCKKCCSARRRRRRRYANIHAHTRTLTSTTHTIHTAGQI